MFSMLTNVPQALDLTESGCKVGDWINVAQDTDHWRVTVNAAKSAEVLILLIQFVFKISAFKRTSV